MRRCWIHVLSLSALVCLLASASQAEETRSLIGRHIEPFDLHDFRGKVHALDDYADKQLVVVAFVGIECPLAKLYAPRLEELWQEYREQGVQFLGVSSNQQDSITELAAFARRNELSFPILKDPDNSIADAFGAERTPEVFLLDGDRVIRYHGRVDDQYGLGQTSGYARAEIDRRDLAVAMDELMAGKTVSVPVTPAPGCIIGRVKKVDPHGDVTYANQISRILQAHCVECHRPGEIGPFVLNDYEEVVGWAEMMREVVSEGRMPPWFADPAHGEFKNDPRLTDEEKELLYTWIDNGCPQGDLSDLPEPIEYAEGWQIGEPDQVIAMEEAYEVPAEGVVDYQYFTMDPGWDEDKWVKAAEARPGNRAVVHHIIAFVHPKGGSAQGAARGGIAGYAPGMPPQDYPEGVALFVPAGSVITFQMHYTPNGTAQTDQSYVGVIFADRDEVKKRARGGVTGTLAFAIPPNEPNYEVTAKKRFLRDTLLVSLTPHMHLRGKSFKFELEYPDGAREVLLDVPRYDFNWQLRYDLIEPKLAPRGAKLHVTAHFDNSVDNPANPDPDSTVRFGEQTWEEMMFGFYTSLDPKEDLSQNTDDENLEVGGLFDESD